PARPSWLERVSCRRESPRHRRLHCRSRLPTHPNGTLPSLCGTHACTAIEHETRVHATLAHTRRDVSSELTFTVALPLFRSESAAIEERVLPKSRARSYS